MSNVATGSPTITETVPALSVRLDTPARINPERFATTVIAAVDLVRVGGLIANVRTVGDGSALLVRRAKYGSPMEIVFSVATGIGSLAAVAYACTQVLNGLADVKVKVATARKLTAETNEIRINQARRFAQDNWRAEEVTSDHGPLEVTERRSLTGGLRYLAQAHDGRLIEVDLREVDDLEIVQADKLIRAFIRQQIATGSQGADADVVRLSAREVRSLILLSELKGEINLTNVDDA
ncbi:MAG: hypothetical protein NVV70_03775 [Cellulomonas sp.]|nr:hypothetical protein [Cellulomonas sp.]MCR6647287.1 hypothetical protein [Cellulomonas sp.]